MIKPWLLVLLGWNIVVFVLYGVDKRRAIQQRQRISERTLLLCSAALGGLGAALGMQIFHHKTRKTKFKILVPLSVVGLGAAVFATYHFFG